MAHAGGIARCLGKVILCETLRFFSLSLLLLQQYFLAGCTQSQQPAQPTPVVTLQTTTDTIKVADSSLGRILTDTNCMTLYYFITDIPASGASTCYGKCETAWPIFTVDSIVVSSPIHAADFSTITRTDGTKQTAYQGWPLYYWQNDKKPGDVLGENVQNVWYVAKAGLYGDDCLQTRSWCFPDG